MTIPFISNVAFTEVDSAGNLNQKAGTSKSKLPVQFFKLTSSITGNLTLDNDTAHKKIILDTNGNTIINDSGSPLTTNSDVTLEIKGAGDIQSTFKSFTKEQTDETFTGTEVITEANNSFIAVNTGDTITQYSTVTSTVGTNVFNGVPDYHPVAGGAPRGNSRNMSITINGVTYNSFTSAFRQVMIDSTRSGGAWNGATVTVTGLSQGTKNATFNSSGTAETRTGTFGPNDDLALGDILFRVGYDGSVGWLVGLFVSSFDGDNNELVTYSPVSQSGSTINNFQIGQTDPDRFIQYTNNLSINTTLTGADPFDGTVVSGSGGTETITRSNSTDGSYNITGTISGSNGSGQPYALVNVNDGTGSINTTNYTGTLSARAF